MNEAWATAIFWLGLMTVSGWVLRRFYFSYDAKLPERLRLAALVIELAIIGLFFFPWLPESRGGAFGWQIALQGNVGMILLIILLLSAVGLFLTKNSRLLKLGASLHFVANILIFVVMIRLLPETIQLTLGDIAPIVATLLLGVNTVVVMLLWHQLQKQEQNRV